MRTCGSCDYTDGLDCTTSPSRVRCSITGGFYSPDESCPVFNSQKQKENQAFWIGYNAESKTAICGNCNRLDHVDPLATHCRYCGIKIKLPPKKEKKVTDKWTGPFKSIQSEMLFVFVCSKCGKFAYLPDNIYKHYTFCPWCGEKMVQEE